MGLVESRLGSLAFGLESAMGTPMIDTPFDEENTGPAKPFADIMWTKPEQVDPLVGVYYAVGRDEFWRLRNGEWELLKQED